MFHVKKVAKKVGKVQYYVYLCNVLEKECLHTIISD